MCVTCHGEEVHRFLPASETCAQAGCHAEEDTRIVLGEMGSSQTTFHCLNCHEFTAPAPEQEPLDTARTALSPSRRQCLACHEMREKLPTLQVGEDAHGPGCGQCHDPHTQERPSAAFGTCTGAGCHARPDTITPFHRGLAQATVEDCGACHEAHTWEVDGRNCGACHADIAGAEPDGKIPGDHPEMGIEDTAVAASDSRRRPLRRRPLLQDPSVSRLVSSVRPRGRGAGRPAGGEALRPPVAGSGHPAPGGGNRRADRGPRHEVGAPPGSGHARAGLRGPARGGPRPGRHILTTPGCPVEKHITCGIRGAVGSVEGVDQVETEVTWEPALHPGTMADDAWER